MLEGIIGFLAGIISSMGFGGGSILLVYLTLFAGVSQKEAAGINLIYFLPCAAAATFFFFKTKFIEKEPVIRLAICSAIGAVAGSVGAIFIDDKIIRIVFAVVLLGVGLKELFSKPKKSGRRPVMWSRLRRSLPKTNGINVLTLKFTNRFPLRSGLSARRYNLVV